MSEELDFDLDYVDGVEQPQSAEADTSTPELSAPTQELDFDLDYVDEKQKEIDELAVNTMAAGDAQRSVEVGIMAKYFNESPDVIALNFDEKKKIYDANQVAKVMEPAENLTAWAANNTDVAPVVKEILGPLAKFETKLAKQEEALRQQRIENNKEFSFSDEPHAWTPDQEEPEDGWFRKVRANFAAGGYAGELQSQVARAYEDDRTGKVPLTEAAKKEAEGKFEELAALEEVYGRNIPYSAGQIAGQMVDMPKSYLDEALSGAAQASAYGAGALAIAGLAGGVTGAVAMAPLAVMAGLGAVYSSTRAIEAGLAYKDMLDRGTPKEEAAIIAGTVGTINGLIESLGDMILGAIGGKAAGLATKTFVRNALHQAVAKQSMGQAFKSVAKGYSGGISTEVTTEVFQEAVNIFGEEYAKRYNGGEAITLDEIRDRLTQIAITTFQGSLVLGAIGAGPVLTHQIHRVHAARNRQQVFSDLAADMKGNEAVQDAPDVVGAAVQHIADKSQASNVYIDGYAFAQTMEANKISIEDLRKVAPEIADQVETARRTGGDIVIPTGEYAVKIAPTDMGESLSMHVRTAEDQLSAAEAVQVDRVVKEQLRTAINDPEALEQQANEQLDGEYKEEAKKLEEHYKAELEKHPRFKGTKARTQARYAATVATQMAKRAGIAPTELMNFAPTLVFTDADQAQVNMGSRAISSDGTFNQSMLTDVMRTAVSKVARIVDRVLNGQSTSGKGRESFEDYLPVSDRLVNDLKEQGLDVEGYQHCVVDADVLHSYKNHGEGNELEKGQIGMTKEDYLRLPLVVAEYDEIHIEGLTQRTNLQGIRYIKTFPDGVQYVVEEVRKGRKKLAFRTAYKKVTPVPDVPNVLVSPPTLRPRRAGVNSLNEDILPVNGSTDQDSYAQSGIGKIGNPTASIDAVKAKYQGTDQWLKAPNGEDTRLTETQWCLVRTPEFKAWFGDWENDPANASKVVDKNGEPLVVYHGGQGRVEDFSRGTVRGHMGQAYFTDSIGAGASYAFLGGIDGTTETPEDAGYIWTHRSDKNIQTHPHITKAFLNIRNPITPNNIHLKDVVNMFGKELADLEEDNVAFAKFDGDFDAAAEWLSDPSNLQEWLEESLTDEVASNAIENDFLSLVDEDGELQASQGFIALHLLGEIPQYMAAKGYDGFAYADKEAGGTTYVVQAPTQIKSASFNNGEFNPNESNIYRQDAAVPLTDPLVTIHNIRETGLLNQLMGEKGAGRLSPAESQARLGALKIAKQMRLAGKDPKEIRLATGWERGTDGLWRFEFPDAQWKDGFFEDRYPDETTYMLSDLVDSPELFEAYPELRTYRVSFSMKESDTLGSHNSGEKRIWINTNQFSGDLTADADVIRSTLLHEIQHAIQKQEGFVGGGNPFDSMMAYQKLLKEEVKPLYELMRSPEWILYQNLLRTGTIDEIAAAEKDPVVQNVFALQQKLRKKYSIDKNDKVVESVIDMPHSDNSVVWNWDEKRYGYKIYERLGGEVESRNVQARMNMTDEQRRQTLLEETADVAPEDQILLESPFLRPNTTRGTYAPGSNTISITLNGDLSTFAHEMGHWYLEQIFKYSKRPDVDPTIVEDAETIKKELGIPDDWDNLTFDAKRKYHEKFAYLTEIYLATGKAPTKSTESFFARMGAWIADVYRQFVGGIKQQRSEQYAKEFGEQLPDISPELQRVFDRMVASQDMLKQAEAAESLRPLFETKPEDMDEATWVEMQSQRMVAEAEGAAKINEIHAKDEKWYTGARSKLLRKLQREAKEIRDNIRERIETQLRNQDVYIAIEIFKTGGKALGLDNLKMDPDALKDAGYTVTEISKLRNLGCVRKGGLTPAQARELLRPFARFKTDKRMIRALINAKPINEAIEEATTEECLRRHSEMFDPVKLDAAVTAALHTEARERMIANELKYLAGTKGMNSRVLNEAARRAAEALVAGTKVGQATVKKYMALESKASRKAYEALAKGDRKAAAVAKHQQLLYSKCVREAMALEKDVAKLKRLKAKIFQSDKKIAKTRDTGILGVARYILTNHGLGKIRAADMDPATAMRYVEKLQKYDYEKFVAFKGLMERHGYKPNDPGLNALTVQELRALIGDVEFCWKASRDAKVIRLGDAAKTRDEVVTELLQQGQSLGLKEYAPGRGEKVTASERASHGLLSIAAQLRRVESWCNSMDAGNPDHPFRRYIYDPVAQACAKYRVANAAIQEKLANLVAARRKDWDKMTDIEAPEIGYVFRTKSELIGAILHTGNQSNKQKLLLGGRGEEKPWARLIEGPDGEVHVDTSAWDAFVQRCYAEGIITKEDMDFVQAVWDLMESEKPLIQKAFHQIYGFYFDEIPATEVQTPWGNYRGGYVPAMTDRYIVAEKGVQEEIERITENEYLSMMPVSRPGFAISRVAGYNKPLSLDIGQLCGHVEKTMRFAHIAPVVQEVAKIINDRDFTDFVNKINPHLISDLLAPWLKRAYNQRIDTGKADGLEKFLGAYRGLAAMGIMMGNVINAIQQTTGLSIAMSKVGAAKLAVANKKLILERGALIEKVETLSPFMKARLKDRSFEYESRVKRAATATGKVFSQRGLYNKAAAVYGKADPLRNWISSHAYLLQTAMQIPIDITVWVAAFDEAVAKGMSDQEAALEADSVVRTTQSSFAAEDIAKIETGGPIKRAFLVFYNYFGMQYNLLLERKAEANLKPWYKKYGTMAADFMLIVWIPAVLSKIFELALRGELGGDDEDEWEAIDWIQLIIGEPIKNVIAFAPIVGGMINSAGAMAAKAHMPLAQAIFGTDPYVGKPMSSPTVDLLENAAKGLADLYKISEGEEVSRRRIIRELLDTTAFFTHIPFGALKKPLGYIGNVMDGEESTDNPIYGVLRGK